MKNKLKILFLYLFSLYIVFISAVLASEKVRLSFTVSMEEPDNHIYQVGLLCEGIEDDAVYFKMPSWTPGYYRVLDFAQNVRDFCVEDQRGRALVWEKTGGNV